LPASIATELEAVGEETAAHIRLYNGGRHTIDRVGRGVFVMPNWSGCLLGGIQPGPIRKIARDGEDDGLLQRFCYCVPSRQERGEDRQPDAEALARYCALFPALAALAPPCGLMGDGIRPVVLHKEAHAHRLAILDLAEGVAAMPDASDRLKSALGKWPGLWARLTLLFHLIGLADARTGAQRDVTGVTKGVATTATMPTWDDDRTGAQCDVANVAKGAATMATSYMRDILLPHLLRAEALMFATEQTGHARWIAEFILSKGESRIAARDIVRAYRPLRAPENRQELQSVMAGLEAAGWVLPASAKDTRATTLWVVNPAVHTRFAERARQERERCAAVKAEIQKKVAHAHGVLEALR
jgi:hypothetical protein